MRIAVLGATSQLARDLVSRIAAHSRFEAVLFARRPDAVLAWLSSFGLTNRFEVRRIDEFSPSQSFDLLLNFVGVGDPARAVAMGPAIYDVTIEFDNMALDYLRAHRKCRYVFMSSGAAYGSRFDEAVGASSDALVPINSLQPGDWYGVAKLHAECRHRALAPLSIVDVRVFNYFSRTQDLSARFLITDAVRAIRTRDILFTSETEIIRDFLHPDDFYNLIMAVAKAEPTNAAVDCYSAAPIGKFALLQMLAREFGLRYEFQEKAGIEATGTKPKYFSLNRIGALLGYVPSRTSAEGLREEISAVLTC